MVYLSVGGGVVVNSVRKGSLVRIGDVNLLVDLVLLDLKEFCDFGDGLVSTT